MCKMQFMDLTHQMRKILMLKNYKEIDLILIKAKKMELKIIIGEFIEQFLFFSLTIYQSFTIEPFIINLNKV